MKFKYNDGGRAKAGFKGTASDCAVRAIAIASGIPYKTVYDEINLISSLEKGRKYISSSRTGVFKKTYHKYLLSKGFKWVRGTKLFKDGELPMGRLVLSLASPRHLTAVINGVIHDQYDPSKNGTRHVYGYFIRKKYAV